MNRREFVATVGAAAVIAAVPTGKSVPVPIEQAKPWSREKTRAFHRVSAMLREFRAAIGKELTSDDVRVMRNKAYSMPEMKREAFFVKEYQRVFNRTPK